MLKFLLLVILVAVTVYLVVRLTQGRGGSAAPHRPAPPRRPLGPEDDPDFLRDLDRNRRDPEEPD